MLRTFFLLKKAQSQGEPMPNFFSLQIDNQKYWSNAALQVPTVEARSARGKLLKTTPTTMSRLKLEWREEYSRGDVYNNTFQH